MKQPRKLTRYQKMIVSKAGLKPKNWMLQAEWDNSLYIVSKSGKKRRWIKKEL